MKTTLKRPDPQDCVDAVLANLRKPLRFCSCGEPFCDGSCEGGSLVKEVPPVIREKEAEA